MAILRTEIDFDAYSRSLLMDTPSPGDTIGYVGFGRTATDKEKSNGEQFTGSHELPPHLSIVVNSAGEANYQSVNGDKDYTIDDYVKWTLFDGDMRNGILSTSAQ